MPNMYRQGDVFLKPVTLDQIPGGFALQPAPKEANRVVLVHGEVTGHSHAFDPEAKVSMFLYESAVNDTLPQGGSRRFLRVDSPSPLKHEEHTTITLPKGLYEVIIQREYAWAAPRRVED